jgi:TolA-binding protein
MKIRQVSFIVLLFWMSFSLTNAIGWLSFCWSQVPQPDQQRPSEQFFDQDMDKAALRIYRNALKYYDDKAYWKGARELIVLLDYYPAFSHADGVLCYMGESLYEMSMHRTAAKMFRFLLTKYPRSEYAAQALYGLQRIHYQTEDYAESLKIFSGIASRFPDDDIIDGGRYHAGMASYHQHDYDNAIATLSKVRARSKYFDYSLYTVGLAYLKKKWSTKPSRPGVNC